MRIVICLGGSLLTRELTTENFKKYADVLKRLKKRQNQLIVACGGGKTAKDYQKIAKELGAESDFVDRVGILGTQMNAMTMIAALGEDAYPYIWTNLNHLKKDFSKIVIVAGMEPRHSTDFDAAIFAEVIKSDILVKATNQDGIYTSDPMKNPDAKKLEKLTYGQMENRLMKNDQKPGQIIRLVRV